MLSVTNLEQKATISEPGGFSLNQSGARLKQQIETLPVKNMEQNATFSEPGGFSMNQSGTRLKYY